jgi:hypothetical protein
MTSANACGFTHLSNFAFDMLARFIGVSIMLGNTALTRTPRSLSSAAKLSVSRETPDFDAA